LKGDRTYTQLKENEKIEITMWGLRGRKSPAWNPASWSPFASCASSLFQSLLRDDLPAGRPRQSRLMEW
jgi:hypothetical protein